MQIMKASYKKERERENEKKKTIKKKKQRNYFDILTLNI